jgi:hypothetical protein
MLAHLPELLAAVSAIVVVLTQLLKYTPVPTEMPKLVAFILSLLIVAGANIQGGTFTTANVGTMAASIGAVSLVAYGAYDVLNTFYLAIKRGLNK